MVVPQSVFIKDSLWPHKEMLNIMFPVIDIPLLKQGMRGKQSGQVKGKTSCN